MGLMKHLSMARRPPPRPPSKNELREVPELPFTPPPADLPPRPPGPSYVDVPMSVPVLMTEQELSYAYHTLYPAWTAINTAGRWRPTAWARWRGRRGALFLYWRAVTREIHRRYGPTHLDRGLLKVHEYNPVIETNKPGGLLSPHIVDPRELPRISPLNARGEMTPGGFKMLDDTEFVWPWPDQTCGSHGRAEEFPVSELYVGLEWERDWPDHWYVDERFALPETCEKTFHGLYAALLKEAGRAGPGTRLGNWLDAWSKRCEAEYTRLNGR